MGRLQGRVKGLGSLPFTEDLRVYKVRSKGEFIDKQVWLESSNQVKVLGLRV